jgi:WD40 repeat protein
VFTGNLDGASLGNVGRTLVIYTRLAILRWDLLSGQSPQVLVDLAPVFGAEAIVAGSRYEWGIWRGAGVSPTEDRMVTSGATTDRKPWIRVIDGNGHVDLLPRAATGGGAPFQVAFAGDGRLLDVFVSALGDGVAGGTAWRLLRVDPSGGGPETVATGMLPAGGPLDADISADRSAAVVWSEDDTSHAMVVDLGRGSVARMSRPARAAPPVDYRALSSGGAVLREDGAVTLVDRTGAVVQELLPPGSEVADVALAPDGTWGVTVGAAGVVLWDVDRSTERWSERETLVGHAGDVLSAEIDPSGERLVTVSADNTIIVWDVRPNGGFGTAQPGLGGRWPAGAPAVVEPGRSAVVPTRAMPDAGKDREDDTLGVAATFIDLRSGEVIEHVPVGDTVPDAYRGASASVSPDGRWIAVTSGLDTTVLDARTREVVEHIPLPRNGEQGLDRQPYPAGIVCCAVWTPDGSRLLLGTGGHLPGALSNGAQPSGAIAVVDTRTWRVVEQVQLKPSPATMQLDDGGRRLAVGSSNSSEILVLDPATLAEVERAPLRVDDSMWALAFSPDGRWLAGAGEQGKVHVIDTETWQAREAVAVRAFGSTLQLGWLPDNRTVVSTGDDGTAVLFDVERAVVRTDPLPASTNGGQGYTALLPGAQEELSLVADARAGLRYPMNPSLWLRAACDVAGRDLTRAEWERYLPGRPWEPTCSDLG